MLQPRLFGVPQQELSSDDYYTPSWLFDLMGIRFDLDVCAPPGGIEWLPADRHFDMEADGLAQPWEGCVWMNPPYSDSAPWVRRFMEHRNGVALVQHCRSRWHSDLWASADSMVDPTHSTPSGSMFQFMRDGKPTNVFMPVVLVAYGEKAVEAIGNVGPARRLVV